MIPGIFEQPAATLPFHLRGQPGSVAVYYGVNEHPEQWGFSLLQLPFDLASIQGFPICQATITYSGRGYQAIMGWIQLITVQETETGKVWVSVDQMPNQRGIDMPFCNSGYLPTHFDAPGPNPPRANETWLAETFLVICPDVGKGRRVAEVLGFSWGYTLEQMNPTPFPVEALARSRWEAHTPFLREH